MSIDQRQIDETTIQRIEVAIETATARRSIIEFDWPECHRQKCAATHGDVDIAFHEMKTAIINAVRAELAYEATTRPDVSIYTGTKREAAELTMATLLHAYRANKTSTYMRAANLMIDAYPELIQVFAPKATP